RRSSDLSTTASASPSSAPPAPASLTRRGTSRWRTCGPPSSATGWSWAAGSRRSGRGASRCGWSWPGKKTAPFAPSRRSSSSPPPPGPARRCRSRRRSRARRAGTRCRPSRSPRTTCAPSPGSPRAGSAPTTPPPPDVSVPFARPASPLGVSRGDTSGRQHLTSDLACRSPDGPCPSPAPPMPAPLDLQTPPATTPDDAWFDGDLSPEDFQALGYRVIDAIADYLRTVRDVPVFPGRTPEEVARVFEEPLPEHGQDPTRILDWWEAKVLLNATNNTSPRYFGFVMGSGTPMGILAEALAASVNMNTGGWQPAPSATEVERRTLAWIAELIGYDPACGGLLVSGGTMANVTALHTALRNAAPYDTTPRGLQDEARTGRFRVYASDHEGHVSLVRAVDLLNLGREALRRVPSRDDYTMDVQALRRMLEEDRARGDVPFCVVAQV